jgi:hypothetical protein
MKQARARTDEESKDEANVAQCVATASYATEAGNGESEVEKWVDLCPS